MGSSQTKKKSRRAVQSMQARVEQAARTKAQLAQKESKTSLSTRAKVGVGGLVVLVVGSVVLATVYSQNSTGAATGEGTPTTETTAESTAES